MAGLQETSMERERRRVSHLLTPVIVSKNWDEKRVGPDYKCHSI